MRSLDFFRTHALLEKEIGEKTLIIIESPIRFLATDEGVIHCGKLVETLHAITARSFGVKEDSVEGMRDHVLGVDLLSILFNKSEILGFSSAKLYYNLNVFYLHGVAVSSTTKSRGVGRALVQEPLNYTGLEKLAFTTQNPVMYVLGKKICINIYPHHEYPIIPSHLREIGKLLMRDRNGSFDLERFVCRGLYSSCLYEGVPLTNTEQIDQWFIHTLRIKNHLTNDGFLFIGNVR